MDGDLEFSVLFETLTRFVVLILDLRMFSHLTYSFLILELKIK